MNVLNKINNRKIRKDNVCDKELTGASLLIYNNLRKNFNGLKNEILGQDYYNMGMDVYSCDDFAIEDILRKFRKLEFKSKMYKILFIISLFIIMLLIVFLISRRQI